MKASLPSFFSFKTADDLVRLGRNCDGGYLVSQSDITNSDLLIGMGINDDWSFEEHFFSRNEVDVYAYDASINESLFLKRFLKWLIRIDKPYIARNYLKTLLSYRRFFHKKKVNHIEKFVGVNCSDEIFCTFLDAINKTKHGNIFLKIDIDGSEYRFLNDLCANVDRISGLVIEIHDCDLHLKRIENFIRDFGLKLVHIHANNHAPINLDSGLPLALELTFSRYAKTLNSTNLPHEFDRPNTDTAAEIEISIDENDT